MKEYSTLHRTGALSSDAVECFNQGHLFFVGGLTYQRILSPARQQKSDPRSERTRRDGGEMKSDNKKKKKKKNTA